MICKNLWGPSVSWVAIGSGERDSKGQAMRFLKDHLIYRPERIQKGVAGGREERKVGTRLVGWLVRERKRELPRHRHSSKDEIHE